MPMSDRDWARGKHPPACTCVECRYRLERTLYERNRKYLEPYPIEPETTKVKNNIIPLLILLLFGIVLITLGIIYLMR